MFQAAFIKRASKLATPATAVSLSAIGVATLWQNQDYDKDIQLNNNSASGIPVSSMQGGKVALCENNDKNNSVIGMLGDIKEKVSAFYFYECIEMLCIFWHCNLILGRGVGEENDNYAIYRRF